jgi:hypothetical protein
MAQAVAEELGLSQGEFFDRRSREADEAAPVRERRQFANSHTDLSPEARELADAIDHYKLARRRRFVTCEEILDVVRSLGYSR